MDEQEEQGIRGLWRLDPDLSLHKIETGIISSNNPYWSSDDKIFDFADTFKNKIRAYDYDLITGTSSNWRVFASTAQDSGFADGSTVNVEAHPWNGRVFSIDQIHYPLNGRVERKISMPVRNITSVMFGRPDLMNIYVTCIGRVAHPATHDGLPAGRT